MISIIVAMSKNRVIGKDNKLIWNLKKDLKRFKEITYGKTIIMGRKTFESLPKKLENRKHIVITKGLKYKIEKDVEIEKDLENIIKKYKNSEEEIFVIGGEQIYNQLINHSEKIYLTLIDKEFIGDTYFPLIDNKVFKKVYKSEKMEENSLIYYYEEYKKIKTC